MDVPPGKIKIISDHFQASSSDGSTLSTLQPATANPLSRLQSRFWAGRAAFMLNLLSPRRLSWGSSSGGQEKVELTMAELESLRSELADLEEKEAYLKAQLEHVDEILRSARLSGYLYIRTRWAALPGDPPPFDDTDVDDWLPRFVVLQGPYLYVYLLSTDLSPQDSTFLPDIVEVGSQPSFTREDDETRHSFYILTCHGVRFEFCNSSKAQVDLWLQELLKGSKDGLRTLSTETSNASSQNQGRIYSLLKLSFGASHSATPAEMYWHSMLPGTPMPKLLRDRLPSEMGSGFNDNAISIDIAGIGIDIGSDGVSVDIGGGGGDSEDGSPFSFSYGGSNVQQKINSNQTNVLFFLEKDLHPGTKMRVKFTKTRPKSTFLPRKVAVRMPFSSNKLSEILNKFSIQPNSTKAKIIRKTIETCEEPGVEGEEKCCAKSLEEMIDFTISKMGRNVEVMVTEIKKDSSNGTEFVLEEGVKMVGDEIVACHDLKYVYPFFYCHKMQKSKAYVVPLGGGDGGKMLAVCHTDTSKWNPNHIAFQVLQVKPGDGPVCHFLPEDSILWVAN